MGEEECDRAQDVNEYQPGDKSEHGGLHECKVGSLYDKEYPVSIVCPSLNQVSGPS
jgi:hypothetical protein